MRQSTSGPEGLELELEGCNLPRHNTHKKHYRSALWHIAFCLNWPFSSTLGEHVHMDSGIVYADPGDMTPWHCCVSSNTLGGFSHDHPSISWRKQHCCRATFAKATCFGRLSASQKQPRESRAGSNNGKVPAESLWAVDVRRRWSRVHQQ